MNSRELPFREIDGSSFLVPSKGPFGGFLSGAGDVVPRPPGVLAPRSRALFAPPASGTKKPVFGRQSPLADRIQAYFFLYNSTIFKLPLAQESQGAEQNDDNEYRCHIANHYAIHLLHAELGGQLDFLGDAVHTNAASHQDAQCESRDWHH